MNEFLIMQAKSLSADKHKTILQDVARKKRILQMTIKIYIYGK